MIENSFLFKSSETHGDSMQQKKLVNVICTFNEIVFHRCKNFYGSYWLIQIYGWPWKRIQSNKRRRLINS